MQEEMPPDMDGTAETWVTNYIFNTNTGSNNLRKVPGRLFHHLVAKLL